MQGASTRPYSADSSTNTIDELHEGICAPYAFVQRNRWLL
jgi:hypothetical protein